MNGEVAPDGKETTEADGTPELTKLTSFRLVHPENAKVPMVATELGMVSVPAALWQSRNADWPMSVSAAALARSMLVRLLQFLNATLPMVATELGMVSVPAALMQ